jgi:hypothetical protein
MNFGSLNQFETYLEIEKYLFKSRRNWAQSGHSGPARLTERPAIAQPNSGLAAWPTVVVRPGSLGPCAAGPAHGAWPGWRVVHAHGTHFGADSGQTASMSS